MKDRLGRLEKLSFKARVALALSLLAFIAAGCGNYSKAPSYGDCLNAGGSNEQCLEIWDPQALKIQETAEGSIYQAARQATQDASNYQAQQTRWANEDMAKEATKNAPRHQLAIVQPGEGILDVLVRMGFNLEAIGPMTYSQIVAVVIDGKFKLFTLKELQDSDPYDPKYRIDIGACVITAPDQFGINQGIEQNQESCLGQ